MIIEMIIEMIILMIIIVTSDSEVELSNWRVGEFKMVC